MSAKNLLTYLVADLIRAEIGQTIPDISDLLTKFKEDPESVIDAYGLTEKAKAVLYTMDRQIIGQFMANEILVTPAGGIQVRWSDPTPGISSVSPVTLQRAPNQVLTIVADCVLSSAVVHLSSLSSYNHLTSVPKFKPKPPHLLGTELEAVFDLSESLPGEYEVLIYNTPESSPLRATQKVTIGGATV